MRAAIALAACSVLAAACTPTEPAADIARSAQTSEGAELLGKGAVRPTSPDHADAPSDPTTTTVVVTTTTEEPTTTTELAPTTVATVRRTTTTAAYVEPAPAGDHDYGEWEIPAYIVMCESGGSWTAENTSGAGGPYQLMPEHFGGASALRQSRAAQHAMAKRLWAGGAGRSNWAACL